MDTNSDSTGRPLLSVAVIACNEADRVEGLLDSVAVADEVVFVDSGSTDGTIEICTLRGARVIEQEWLGYAKQKQLAMEQTQGEWILSLDADEMLSPEAAQEILHAIRNAEPHVTAFSIPRLSRYLNRWIRHGGWYPDRKIRLVRRGCGHWVGDGIHEKLQATGTVRELKKPLLHSVYRDISDQLRTINRFSTVFAENRPHPASPEYVLLGVFHGAMKFVECAIWKLGILDGLPGLIIAVNSAFYVFLKHAKAWERGLPKE